MEVGQKFDPKVKPDSTSIRQAFIDFFHRFRQSRRPVQTGPTFVRQRNVGKKFWGGEYSKKFYWTNQPLDAFVRDVSKVPSNT